MSIDLVGLQSTQDLVQQMTVGYQPNPIPVVVLQEAVWRADLLPPAQRWKDIANGTNLYTNVGQLITDFNIFTSLSANQKMTSNQVIVLDQLIATLRASKILSSPGTLVGGTLTAVTAEPTLTAANLNARLRQWADQPGAAAIAEKLFEVVDKARLADTTEAMQPGEATLQHMIRFEYVQRGNEIQFNEMGKLHNSLKDTDNTLGLLNRFQDILAGKQIEKGSVDLAALQKLGDRKNGSVSLFPTQGDAFHVDQQVTSGPGYRFVGGPVPMPWTPLGSAFWYNIATDIETRRLSTDSGGFLTHDDAGGNPGAAGWAQLIFDWEEQQFDRELQKLTSSSIIGLQDTATAPMLANAIEPGSVMDRYLGAFGDHRVHDTTAPVPPPYQGAILGGVITTTGPGTSLRDLVLANRDNSQVVGEILFTHISSVLDVAIDEIQTLASPIAELGGPPNQVVGKLVQLQGHLSALRFERAAVGANVTIYDVIIDAAAGASGDGRREGTFQGDIDSAINAATALNDAFKEELRRRMFEFEEFYKSASALIAKITQIIEKFAQMMAR